MKYQALYDYVLGSEIPYTFVQIQGEDVYPQNIVIPAAGYAVPLATFAQSRAPGVTEEEKTYAEDWWDTNIEKALIHIDTVYMFVFKQKHPEFENTFWLTVGPALVFNEKQYAMGFVHGYNYNSVYAEQVVIDLMTNRAIRRKT